MERTDTPSRLQVAEVVVANAIPVFGVIFLGWSSVLVVFLYLVDGWMCILALGLSLVLGNLDELRPLITGRTAFGRAMKWAASIVFLEAILSMFAVIPGIMVMASVGGGDLGDALGAVFAEKGVWLSVVLLVGSHGMRLWRGARSRETEAPMDPKQQFALFVHRIMVMVILASVISPTAFGGLLMPFYLAAVAALFSYTDLYPGRYLERLRLVTRSGKGEDAESAAARGARQRMPKPRLPK